MAAHGSCIFDAHKGIVPFATRVAFDKASPPMTKRAFAVATVAALSVVTASLSAKAEYKDKAQCLNELKIVEDMRADASIPTLGEKYTKTLEELLGLAKQRCDSGQFKNAEELIALARGMLASE